MSRFVFCPVCIAQGQLRMKYFMVSVGKQTDTPNFNFVSCRQLFLLRLSYSIYVLACDILGFDIKKKKNIVILQHIVGSMMA